MNISNTSFAKAGRMARTRTLTAVAMLSALSYVLAFITIPMPLSPAFARLDFADLPAVIAAFAIGPLAGVCVEFIKNALQLLTTSTGGIGEFANFIMGAAFAATAGLVYRRVKGRYAALLACIASSVAMAVVAALANNFILLPLYSNFMPMDELIASFGTIIPAVKTRIDVIMLSVIPGNIIKGIVISVPAMLLCKKILPAIKWRKK